MNRPADQKSYLARVCVSLTEPIASAEGDSPPVVGYYRVLGFWCEPDGVRPLLSAEVQDGTIDWKETSWSERRPSDVDEPMKRNVVADSKIWFRSGRMFFN
jgi:hypothetical protein